MDFPWVLQFWALAILRDKLIKQGTATKYSTYSGNTMVFFLLTY